MSGIKRVTAYKYMVSVYGRAPWKSKHPALLFTDDYVTEEEATRAAESYSKVEATIYGIPMRSVVYRVKVDTTVEPLAEFRRPWSCVDGGKNESSEGMSEITGK